MVVSLCLAKSPGREQSIDDQKPTHCETWRFDEEAGCRFLRSYVNFFSEFAQSHYELLPIRHERVEMLLKSFHCWYHFKSLYLPSMLSDYRG